MPVIDPLTVAQMAISGMQLKPVDIGIVPSDEPGKVGLVGMPVWMWNKDTSPSTNGPVTNTASVGGVTVSATATLTSVTWNMGDGNLPEVCPGYAAPFTPYTDAAGDLPSPTCGHKYVKSSIDKPGGRFQVTATSAWVVNWVVVGGAVPAGGVIPMVLTSDTSVQIGEMQVLVTPS
ncbi:ATP/GTP-binding protein [Rhodococcus hoagii]|nr:ATP/GTP-binding protein [Prescottella equi]